VAEENIQKLGIVKSNASNSDAVKEFCPIPNDPEDSSFAPVLENEIENDLRDLLKIDYNSDEFVDFIINRLFNFSMLAYDKAYTEEEKESFKSSCQIILSKEFIK
jgi:hypothetical protein